MFDAEYIQNVRGKCKTKDFSQNVMDYLLKSSDNAICFDYDKRSKIGGSGP